MRVSVCGCGWLGLPLAKQLVRDGYEVYGSNRDKDRAVQLTRAGIRGIALSLPIEIPETSSEADGQYCEFFKTDVLVINVPPGREESADMAFVKKIKCLSTLARKHGCKRVIFISTTSVYGSATGEITESTVPRPNTASGRAHLQIEQWLHEQWGRDAVVLRLAGLIGPGRHPVKFLSGRLALANGSEPVNLVHLDDCIQVIRQIIACWPSQQVLHLAAPSHPTRQNYYTEMAIAAGLPLPEFDRSVVAGGKVVNAEQTLGVLGLTMIHPNLMAMSPELP
ncbi:SDR family oxidoreductase [Photobacterium chitinilyticum]|uniref:SDR family oxidoreductase n=1 Tax=Photobacterium chitinilyticum TaxID=2485123 RepID=A0A444JQL1_9GAMM|nr:SDR family oxidoreductase [Photobacterium chitinilyticum]RWX55390.1 SDR family oxidoreductase [Photobacterium chitinilyticum]